MSDMTSPGPNGMSSPVLYLAFDLSEADWHLGFTIGAAPSPWERQIKAGDLPKLRQEIQLAKQRFALPASATIRSG